MILSNLAGALGENVLGGNFLDAGPVPGVLAVALILAVQLDGLRPGRHREGGLLRRRWTYLDLTG